MKLERHFVGSRMLKFHEFWFCFLCAIPLFLLNLLVWTSSCSSESMAMVILVSKANDLVLALGVSVFFVLISRRRSLKMLVWVAAYNAFLNVSNGMILNFNSLYYREQPLQFNGFFLVLCGMHRLLICFFVTVIPELNNTLLSWENMVV